MPIYLKQSTASQEIPIGLFVDDADGKTAETGLTIANTDVRIWKAGATALVSKNSGGATHMAAGVYYAVLDATDTNTVGPLVVFVHVAGALPVRVECDVLPANVFDARYGADLLDVNVSQFGNTAGTFAAGRPEVNASHAGGTAWGSGAITAASIAASAIADTKIAAGAITSGKFAAGAINAAAIATGAITNAKFAAGAIDAAAVATNAIDADALAADAGTEIGSAVWATAARTLTASSDPTAAAIADAVWDEARSGHVGAGTFGEGVASVQGNLTGSVGSVTGAVGSVTGSVGSVTGAVGSVTGSVGSLGSQAKSDVNAEVVDVLTTDTAAELGAVPAAASSIAARIGWLFLLARNKIVQTSTTQAVRNDADGADVATASVGDDGSTFTRGEYV